MDKEPAEGKVFIQGVDYNLPDPDDNPYAQARRFAEERKLQKADSPVKPDKVTVSTGGLSRPRSPLNYPDQREMLDRQRYNRRRG